MHYYFIVMVHFFIYNLIMINDKNNVEIDRKHRIILYADSYDNEPFINERLEYRSYKFDSVEEEQYNECVCM